MKRIEPRDSQESVWDYPRPPRLEASTHRVQVAFGGETIADTTRAFRVLETSHPPVYYIPREDVRTASLERSRRRTVCEWKGSASFWTVRLGEHVAADAAWSYEDPTPSFAPIRGYLAFYPARMDACYVNGERVQAQPGDFYGGWITAAIIGPFKGGPGSSGW